MPIPPVLRKTIRYLIPGEPVSAGVTNRPIRDLHQAILYLRDQLVSVGMGKALVLTNQTVALGTRVGSPVYLDTDNTWKPAIAELSQGSAADSARWAFSSRAYVSGVVTSVRLSTASVCIAGEISLSAADFTAVSDGSVQNGVVYLSARQAGLLSSNGTLSVRVGTLTGPVSGSYRLFVSPETRFEVAAHSHYHFALYALPAGTPLCSPVYETGMLVGELEPGGPYPEYVNRITEEDVSARGWLPVSSAAFADKTIPSGAKFGYNLAAHPELQAVWPPQPYFLTEHVRVERNGVGLHSDVVVINGSGIWWMDDAYLMAPWPVNYRPCDNESESDSESEGSVPDSPPVHLDIYFTTMTNAGGSLAVRDITSPNDSVYAYRNQSGTAQVVVPASYMAATLPLHQASADIVASTYTPDSMAPLLAYPYHKMQAAQSGTDKKILRYILKVGLADLPPGVMPQLVVRTGVMPVSTGSVSPADVFNLWVFAAAADTDFTGRGLLSDTPLIGLQQVRWTNAASAGLLAQYEYVELQSEGFRLTEVLPWTTFYIVIQGVSVTEDWGVLYTSAQLSLVP